MARERRVEEAGSVTTARTGTRPLQRGSPGRPRRRFFGAASPNPPGGFGIQLPLDPSGAIISYSLAAPVVAESPARGKQTGQLF